MFPKFHSQYQLEEPSSRATVFSIANIIERNIDNNFTDAIQCGRKGRGFHTGGSWERYSPILMKSGRAAAWAARSASSSSSHLAAISGSGSPPRLPRPPSPPPPPSPAAFPSPSFLSLFFPVNSSSLRPPKRTYATGKQDWTASSLKCTLQAFVSDLNIYARIRELCFENHDIAETKSAMIVALREPETNGRVGSSNNTSLNWSSTSW